MSRLRWMAASIAWSLLSFAVIAATEATTLPAFSLDGSGNIITDTSATSLGYTFHTTEPLKIAALGVYDKDGTTIAANGGSLLVNLYANGGGVPLATATVLATDPTTSLAGGTYTSGDAFRYHSITELVLPIGNYQIVSGSMTTIPFRYVAGNTPLTGVVIDLPVYLYAAAPAAYTTNTYSPNIAGNFGPNFLVSVVPEPSSFIMLVAACSAFVTVARGAPPQDLNTELIIASDFMPLDSRSDGLTI